jgi:uncharacterized metal-binding protein YceD (DUF177 family)
MTPPELSRPFNLDHLAEATRVTVQSNAEERAALARRMGVPHIHHLACSFHLRRGGGAIIQATGTLHATVTQTCVVSLEPFDTAITEDFSVRFVPAGTESDDLDIEADDEIPYAGNLLDLGEAAAEQLALALDPFPRKPGAEMPAETNAEGNAFAGLAKLRKEG